MRSLKFSWDLEDSERFGGIDALGFIPEDGRQRGGPKEILEHLESVMACRA